MAEEIRYTKRGYQVAKGNLLITHIILENYSKLEINIANASMDASKLLI